MAEGAGLENRYTRKGIEGSNPSLSVPAEQVCTPIVCDGAAGPELGQASRLRFFRQANDVGN